jgi:hypothetical protein
LWPILADDVPSLATAGEVGGQKGYNKTASGRNKKPDRSIFAQRVIVYVS